MYKLVSVVVDSDAYDKTYEFRAIVKQSTETSYENNEARDVLLDVLSLNDIFEVKMRGDTSRNDMVEMKGLVQTDDKFVDGLYVSFRNCNKNAYSFTDLIRDDIAIMLDWHDCEPTDSSNVVSEALTVFGKLKIVKTVTESGDVRYTSVLASQQFSELILRDFSASLCVRNAKTYAENLLVMAMTALLFDDSYSNYTGFTFEAKYSIEECNRGVLNTSVGKVFIENVFTYPSSPDRIYSCKLLFPWSSGDYVTMHSTKVSSLPVEVDLLIKKKINMFLNKIKFI